MTEAEWLVCTDPLAMLEVMSDPQPGRKHWLFNCACCRLVWSDLSDERSRRAVEAAEVYIDDPLYEKAWESAYFAAWKLLANTPHPQHLSFQHLDFMAGYAAFVRHDPATEDMHLNTFEVVSRFSQAKGECASLCSIVRDLIGPLPFRHVLVDPRWLTRSVSRLATSIYDNRIMPPGTLNNDLAFRLAEALEEAGCSDADILTHLKGAGPHVRGCWVVDLLLSKG